MNYYYYICGAESKYMLYHKYRNSGVPSLHIGGTCMFRFCKNTGSIASFVHINQLT